MVSTRNYSEIKNNLIDYISTLGLQIHTNTKARGHNGFFKEGRIDISKNLEDDFAIRTILHEYAHYIHFQIDKKVKDLDKLFDCDEDDIVDELFEITNYVDENSLCLKLFEEKDKLKNQIKNLTNSIRMEYSDFNLSEEFKPFKKYAKWSNLRYLEKYDRVRVLDWFTPKIYSITNVRKDFPKIPDVFVDYLKLKSNQRKRAKLSRKINKLKKYYTKPTELFARFIECLYIDIDFVREHAPICFGQFVDIYKTGRYSHLDKVFNILGIDL